MFATYLFGEFGDLLIIAKLNLAKYLNRALHSLHFASFDGCRYRKSFNYQHNSVLIKKSGMLVQ